VADEVEELLADLRFVGVILESGFSRMIQILTHIDISALKADNKI
jgi:hypothetical protein